jgi:hypothetical protein
MISVVSKPKTTIGKILVLMAKIADGSEGNESTKYLKVEKINDDEMRLIVTDCKRCMVVTTRALFGVESGLYAVAKSKEGIYLNAVIEQHSSFPDVDNAVLKTWDVEYEIAACLSKNSSVYPIIFNKTGDETREFRFVNMTYIEDFVKLISIGYNSVTVKGTSTGYQPVQMEWKCAEFEVTYIVMPMSTDTYDIVRKVTNEEKESPNHEND